METVLSRLQLDHANMSRLLDIVDAQLQLVADAQNADFELMRDILHYLTNYSDAIHHPTEDLLYARLADVSVSARKDLARIPEEHERIEGESRSLLETLTLVADGTMALRSDILERGNAYVASLRKHIEMEEKYLFPMIERLLDESDMAEVQQIYEANQDPVFGPVVRDDFRDLYRYIEEQSA